MNSPFVIQNTRLFPKFKGAAAYQVTGIASRCDWVILTDGTGENFSAVLRGNPDRQPKTVFLSMRSPFKGLRYFYNTVLPKISAPFVLVSGSEDVTCPRQTDQRWRAFSEEERQMIDAILCDDRVLHWFMENRDEVLAKTSSLPVGYVIGHSQSARISPPSSVTPIAARPGRVFCAHRVRQGAQWDVRRQVTKTCQQYFGAFCNVATDELTVHEFEHALGNHVFVICAEGGGIDPSPKAWQSIMHGAIPIIKSGPLDDAYAQLPVAFVKDWTWNFLTVEKLNQWQVQLEKYYNDPELRAQTLNSLSLDYWWEKIEEHL